MVDWPLLFDSIGVEYKLGPSQSVRAGHIGINCPNCDHDSKFFFSIELSTGKVRGCWWDTTHWMSPIELIAKLARCSYEQAKAMAEDQSSYATNLFSSKSLLKKLEKPEATATVTKLLTWPKQLQPFHAKPCWREKPFHRYLLDRGFDSPFKVADCYDLRWADTGPWQMRIAFPLLSPSGLLAGWTARAVTRSARLRYKLEPPGDASRRLIWNLPADASGELLVLCEGPFDALKLDWYSGSRHVRAAALLGLNVGLTKISMIVRSSRGFNKTMIVLDRGAEAQAMALKQELAVISPGVAFLPEGFKDPGEMPARAVRSFVRELLAEHVSH